MAFETCSRQIVKVVFVLSVFIISEHVAAADDNDTLELLQVLVRHGNRTSIGVFLPFIPEYIDRVQPFAFGLLTAQGRRQMVNFGEFFRERYASFLPTDFSYLAVGVDCCAEQRTVESAMVAMATIFPPREKQRWQDSGLGAEWTPVSCNYIPPAQDVVLNPNSVDCPRFRDLRNQVYAAPAFVARYNYLIANGTVIEYIQRSLNMSTAEPLSESNLRNVFDTLFMMESMDMPLPDWSKAVYPSPLGELNHLGLWAQFASAELMTFSVGEYLRQIITTAEDVQNRVFRPLARKMHISFGHDLTIMPLMVALGLENDPHQPMYGAAFIMELHRIPQTDEIGFKFVYRNESWVDPIVYTMPGCQEICPVSFVKQAVQQYIPSTPFMERCPLDQD